MGSSRDLISSDAEECYSGREPRCRCSSELAAPHFIPFSYLAARRCRQPPAAPHRVRAHGAREPRRLVSAAMPSRPPAPTGGQRESPRGQSLCGCLGFSVGQTPRLAGAPTESRADGSGAAAGWPCHSAAPSYSGERAARAAAPAAKGMGKAAGLTLSRDFEPSAHLCQLTDR